MCVYVAVAVVVVVCPIIMIIFSLFNTFTEVHEQWIKGNKLILLNQNTLARFHSFLAFIVQPIRVCFISFLCTPLLSFLWTYAMCTNTPYEMCAMYVDVYVRMSVWRSPRSSNCLWHEQWFIANISHPYFLRPSTRSLSLILRKERAVFLSSKSLKLRRRSNK